MTSQLLVQEQQTKNSQTQPEIIKNSKSYFLYTTIMLANIVRPYISFIAHFLEMKLKD